MEKELFHIRAAIVNVEALINCNNGGGGNGNNSNLMQQGSPPWRGPNGNSGGQGTYQGMDNEYSSRGNFHQHAYAYFDI